MANIVSEATSLLIGRSIRNVAKLMTFRQLVISEAVPKRRGCSMKGNSNSIRSNEGLLAATVVVVETPRIRAEVALLT